MNKKAAAEEYLEQIPYIILTVIVVGAILVMIGIYANLTVDVQPVFVSTFYYRMLYSPGGISYTDESGTVSPGLVDLRQFTTQNIAMSAQYEPENYISAKFEIVDKSGKSVAIAYFDNDTYQFLSPMADAGITGSGSATKFRKDLPIVYRLNGVLFDGMLRTTIILPN